MKMLFINKATKAFQIFGNFANKLRNRFFTVNIKEDWAKPHPLITLFMLIIVLILTITFASSHQNLITKSDIMPSSNNSHKKVQIQPPKSTVVLNKEFLFPILDKDRKEVAKLNYTIEKAELRDEIIVKGQKATAISGRTFLIITLKIINESDKNIEVNTRDYVRLSLNNNDQELLAPEIHNDPVKVQPVSTKNTRLGFPINDTDKNLKLYVGEIKGKKTQIDLQF